MPQTSGITTQNTEEIPFEAFIAQVNEAYKNNGPVVVHSINGVTGILTPIICVEEKK